MASDRSAVQAIGTSMLVILSVGAVGCAGLLSHFHRGSRQMASLAKWMTFLLPAVAGKTGIHADA